MQFGEGRLPDRFKTIKDEIAASVPNFQEHVTTAWADLLGELKKETAAIANEGSQVGADCPRASS